MPYFLLALAIGVALLNSGFQNRFCKSRLKGFADVLAFNLLACLGAVAVLLLFNLGFRAPSLYTVLLGIVFGAVTGISQMGTITALSQGPMSFTVLINSCSLLLPTFSGALFWGESVSALQYVGVAALVLSLILVLNPQKDKQITSKWVVFVSISFVGNGVLGIMQKIHQTSAYKAELNEFLIVAFISSALIMLGALLITIRKGQRPQAYLPLNPRPILLAMTSGVCSGVLNNVNLYLSGVLPTVVFFPLFNGGVILLSALSARWVFREKMAARQAVGLMFATLSLCLVGNVGRLLGL